MSSQYIQRLRAVRDEFEAARQGIAFVSSKWHQHNIYQDVNGVAPKDFKRAGDYLFATYLIRLSVDFEGTLKYHLTSNHPGVSIGKDAKVDWLISKVAKAEGIQIDSNLQVWQRCEPTGMILFTPVNCPQPPLPSNLPYLGLTHFLQNCPTR